MNRQNAHSRREFLGLAGATALAAGTNMVEAETVRETSGPVPVVGTYDVIVCGGGTSGLPAAVAAARQGAKVAIIDRYGFLGGNAAFSIMPAWHGLTDHHSGLLTEFAHDVAEFGAGPNPLENRHIEPEVVKILFLNMALRARVHLHLHHFITGVVKDRNNVTTVVTESKSGRRAYAAKVFVDATGDGDVSYHAGADYNKGDNGKVQAMTLRFRIGYVDIERYLAWVIKNLHLGCFRGAGKRAIEQMMRRAREGRDFYFGTDMSRIWEKDPDEELPRNTYFVMSSIRPNELSINSTRIYDVDGTNADDLSKAEVTTRKQAWAIWRYLKKNIPGFDKSMIVETAPQVGVRETRTIVGDYVLTDSDCRAMREFEDSVLTCRVTYDSHDKQKYETFSIKGGLVEVPYRCLLPRGLEGVLVVGRCISSDHLANSAIRRMESAFQLGQIGGTAAGMAARQRITPRALRLAPLLEQLKKDRLKTSQNDFTA
ncbi:MAG: FAD-dependent oxidoreductase [Planctomycetota bacterium]